jgi:hypothetical protein
VWPHCYRDFGYPQSLPRVKIEEKGTKHGSCTETEGTLQKQTIDSSNKGPDDDSAWDSKMNRKGIEGSPQGVAGKKPGTARKTLR